MASNHLGLTEMPFFFFFFNRETISLMFEIYRRDVSS